MTYIKKMNESEQDSFKPILIKIEVKEIFEMSNGVLFKNELLASDFRPLMYRITQCDHNVWAWGI